MKVKKPKDNKPNKQDFSPWRERLHEIIFEADSRTGKLFDIVLLFLIVASVVLVMLDTIEDIVKNPTFRYVADILEWAFTIIFTLEYILRLISVSKPSKYALSFFGLVDLLAILPSYLALLPFWGGTGTGLAAVRAMRLVRVFRIFKLAQFLKESNSIVKALKASWPRITVFLTFVIMMVIVMGSIMYVIEGGQPDTGFTSIPRSIYWGIVTITTVGYGDISPTTPVGQAIAAVMMIVAYGILAVGVLAAPAVEPEAAPNKTYTTRSCKACLSEDHDLDAVHCKYCGDKLGKVSQD